MHELVPRVGVLQRPPSKRAERALRPLVPVLGLSWGLRAAAQQQVKHLCLGRRGDGRREAAPFAVAQDLAQEAVERAGEVTLLNARGDGVRGLPREEETGGRLKG